MKVFLIQTTVSLVLVLFASPGRCTIYWMNLFDPKDYRSLADILHYLRELRTGVPPLLSTMELFVYRTTGSLFLVSEVLYRTALAAAFLIPVYFKPRSQVCLFVAACVSVVFLWASVLIHPMNPEIYDIFFPLFALLYTVTLHCAGKSERKPLLSILFAFISGLFLSAIELTRPFVLFLVPFLLVHSIVVLGKKRKRLILWHLVPLLVLSGGWHLKLFLFQEGQIVWSNHTGFNLVRAWGECFEKENTPNLYSVKDESSSKAVFPLNSPEHWRESRRLQRQVLQCLLHHPFFTLGQVVKKILFFFQPRMAVYNAVPPDRPVIVLLLYRFCVWFCAFVLAAETGALIWAILRRGDPGKFESPQTGVVILAVGSVIFLALGDRGEEARFLISVLPFLVALLPSSFYLVRHGPEL